jgi:hypothetical protein
MTTGVLEIEYHGMAPWALPLRAAIEANPTLSVRDAEWQQGPLSDLAFAISTRLGYFADLVALVDENLTAALKEVEGKDTELDQLLRSGVSFRFQDYAHVRRALIAASVYLSESRACYENIARFYRFFLRNYFEQFIGEEAALEAIAHVIPGNWSADLRRLRNDVLHQRSLWLALTVSEQRYEPIFLLNWRPGQFQPDDCITMTALRAIAVGLHQAAASVRMELIKRVREARSSR